MSYLDSNLSLLLRRQPELAALLGTLKCKHVETYASASGLPSANYRLENALAALHSKYSPMKEARQLVRRCNPGQANYFVILGFGLGYVLDALLELDSERANHYFIIESDLEIIRAAFEARDLSAILTLPNVHFVWPTATVDLAQQWGRFFDPVRAHASAYISHDPSISLNPGFFKAAAEVIQSQTFHTYSDINTLVDRAQKFLDNFVQNIPRAVRAPGVAKFRGCFPKTPAVIVSAGPSLDKNIHELRTSRDRVLILSTDTALKPLLAADIDPHFVLTGDPAIENYFHLKGSRVKNTIFVAEATAYPGVFTEFAGRIITCTFENSALRSLCNLLGAKGTLRAWGSVATMALDFALILGCDPVIFIGQDLAHTQGRLYCSGIYFDDDWYSQVHSPEEWVLCMEHFRASKRAVMMDDIFGKPIESTDKLLAYWNWFSKELSSHPGVQFINATEGGILKENVSIMTLREALHRNCRDSLDLSSRLAAKFAIENESRHEASIPDLSCYKKEAHFLRQLLKEGIATAERSSLSEIELVRRLERIKESVYEHRNLAPLLDCLNQMGNVTFLRKQARLTELSPEHRDFRREVRDTYKPYYESVSEALAKLDLAIEQIEAALGTL